jgi:hypothetical protein
MQLTNIFNYFSLPGQSFKPTTFRSMNFKFVLNGSPKIMNFVKNVLSKLAFPILFNDLFISFAFVCKGEIHTGLMKLCEFIVSLIRLPIHFIVEAVLRISRNWNDSLDSLDDASVIKRDKHSLDYEMDRQSNEGN